jgi:peptidoglycan/xylan/chitin deacetylase (PgdA/CDA1 family)
MKLMTLPKILKRAKRDNILFNAVGWDWRRPGVRKIVKNVLKDVRQGSIILLHDGDGDNNKCITDRSQTVQAAEIIIQKLKEKGYRFVTISELLRVGKKR